MDFEKIYNECSKLSEKIFAKDEYGIEVFTSGKWETLKRNSQGKYNTYKGRPAGFKTEKDALDVINELKHTISFQNSEMRLTTDK